MATDATKVARLPHGRKVPELAMAMEVTVVALLGATPHLGNSSLRPHLLVTMDMEGILEAMGTKAVMALLQEGLRLGSLISCLPMARLPRRPGMGLRLLPHRMMPRRRRHPATIRLLRRHLSCARSASSSRSLRLSTG